jgi:cephalosporin hydroxylase
MKNLFEGEVYEFLKYRATKDRAGWGGNAGIIDPWTEEDLSNSKKGVEFITNFLNEVKPKTILETGTNYGSFSYVLYETLENFKHHTCDIVEKSKECIDYINGFYGKENVQFYHMDSLEFLTKMKDERKHFDLLWIDSHHTYEFLLSELRIAGKLESPYIMIDDVWGDRGLQMAILQFMNENNRYKIHSYSNVRASVGSIMI